MMLQFPSKRIQHCLSFTAMKFRLPVLGLPATSFWKGELQRLRDIYDNCYGESSTTRLPFISFSDVDCSAAHRNKNHKIRTCTFILMKKIEGKFVPVLH